MTSSRKNEYDTNHVQNMTPIRMNEYHTEEQTTTSIRMNEYDTEEQNMTPINRKDKCSFNEVLGLVINVVGLILLTLAFGLPYWVYYDTIFDDVMLDSGSRENIRLTYHFGFWSYCNSLASSSANVFNQCGAARTSSDVEQITVCLVLVAILFSASSVVNVCLSHKVCHIKRFIMLVAVVSDLIAGVVGSSAVLYFMLNDHSYDHNIIKLQFTLSNLHLSFYLLVSACVCIILATITTIGAFLKYKHDVRVEPIDISEESDGISFEQYETTDDDMRSESSTSLTLITESSTISEAPFEHFADHSETHDDRQALSMTDGESACSSSVSSLTDDERPASKANTDAIDSKLDGMFANRAADTLGENEDHPNNSKTLDEEAVSECSAEELGSPVHNPSPTLRHPEFQSNTVTTDSPVTSDTSISDTSASLLTKPSSVPGTVKSIAISDTSAAKPDKPNAISHPSNAASLRTGISKRQTMTRIKKTKRPVPMTKKLRKAKQVPSPWTKLKQKNRAHANQLLLNTVKQRKNGKRHITQGQRKRDEQFLQRTKTLINVYSNPPFVPVGVMGAIPLPKPITHSRHQKRPSNAVIESGKRFMTSIQAYRRMRSEWDKQFNKMEPK